MKLRIKASEFMPPASVLAGAAARGLEVLVIEHLRRKNATTEPNRHGLPKTNYYAEASNNVAGTFAGNKATVEVDHPGLALHYEGGTVYPKKKALAIPVDASVAGIWPSELGTRDDERYALIWPKNSSHGFIKDTETSELLYMLIRQATLKADATVLPTDAEIYAAAEAAIQEALS